MNHSCLDNQGVQLEVRSLKVVQGLEAEYTNKFLIALAECASNPAIDNDEAVRRCLRGDAPGQGPLPMKRVSAFETHGGYLC